MPAFTLALKGDKYTFNRARFNLHSLLIPVHNREKAMYEFQWAAMEWRNLSAKGDACIIKYFCLEGVQRKSVEKCVKEYIR